MNLVIVESPAKAKTIQKFLGNDFTVKSCYGHIRDLASKDLSIDVDNGFLPKYEVMADKKNVISELKKLTKDSELIWLATDEDREGEAISWHLYDVLGLTQLNTRRIVFHEITKTAIDKAISTPREIDLNLVNAQQARRVLDRLVGFEISPVLWKKVKPSLSAGRVQSVTVRLIVEREREIDAFKTESAYRLVALFQVKGKQLKAELPKRFKTRDEAETFLKNCVGAQYSIESVETKPAKRTPAPPFTTSTLQQEAGRKLGFSVSQTMTLAQKLYESGHITYMRTDSVNLSELAINTSKAEIERSYGSEYSKVRQFATKSKGAQEAHEAIRPTEMSNHSVEGDSGEKRLYDLIWKRTIASQMADAQLERTTISIAVSTVAEKFSATGEVIKFDGFLKVYMESTDDEDEESKDLLPPVKKGDSLVVEKITATERFTHHPARYSEASLVKKLEELGIGRPSTYAPTISTVQKRGYVVKEDREGKSRIFGELTLIDSNIEFETKTETTGREKSKLFPTDIGTVVNDFLKIHFDQIMDYNFTAQVEKEFDEIAQGEKKWDEMIKAFYSPFHTAVTDTIENSEKATGERLLGSDPKSGKNMYAKIGRFGPMIQVGENDDEEKPKFTSLNADQSINTITLEQALELFKLPRVVGKRGEDEVIASSGKFGPYIKYKGSFVSLGKVDPMTITLQEAIQMIDDKAEADAKKVIRIFEEDKEIKVLNGRYGPYIAKGKNNYKIPKTTKPEELTYADCLQLIEEQKDVKPKKFVRKKK